MTEPDFSLTKRRAEKARLAGGGGSSNDGGMLEQRVAVLEADMREIKGILARIEKRLDSIDAKFDRFDERLRKVEVDVAEMKSRVAQLPTAWTLLTGGAGLILATFGFSFALVRFGIPH